MKQARDLAGTAAIAALLAFAVRCCAAPAGWWWLLVPALAVALAFASGRALRSAVAFRRGWLFGTCFVLGDLAWVILPAGAHLGPALYAIAAAISAVEALPVAIAAWAFARTGVRHPLSFCLGVPALYALLETLRASGPLGLPLATLGATQTAGPFAVTLTAGGVPLATFSVLATAATLVCLVRGIREARLTPGAVRATALASATAIALLAAATLVWHAALGARGHAPLARIGIVEAGPIGLGRSFAASAQDYASATLRLPKDVDFALWPEGVLYLIADDAARQRALATGAARAFGRTILAGATLRSHRLLHNDLVSIDPVGRMTSVYTKRRLVPFGEYQPFAFGGPQRATYASGKDGEPPVRVGGGAPFGALICFEAVFPDLTRASVDGGAAYVVAVLNDSWFGGTGGPAQLAQVLAAGAIANGVTIVRADTVPPSGAIDAGGDWIGTPLRSAGVVTVAVPAGIVTPFRRFGPWPALAAFAMLVVASLPRARA